MKITLTSGYTFTPGTRVLDFSGYAGFDVKRLLGVLNATAGKILYAPGLAGYGYTALTGSALTLAVNTTAMSASDKLVVLYDDVSPQAVRNANGFTPAQTFPATAVFISGNTAGTGGTNATVTEVVAANANRGFIEIINNGTADVELWMPGKPADANVGQAVKKGVVIPPGGGRSYDARVPLSAIYATTTAAGVLSVIEG